MLTGGQKHGTKGSAKIGGMSNVIIIQEYGRAVRLYVQFQFGSVRAWIERPRVSRHFKLQNMQAPRFHNKGLCEIVIAGLPHGDFMLTRQEHDLLVAL